MLSKRYKTIWVILALIAGLALVLGSLALPLLYAL